MNKPHRIFLIKLIGWLMLIAIILLSLVRIPAVPSPVPNSDKILHLFSYFIISYWFLHAYSGQKTTITLSFIGLGCALEYLQSLTGYRFMEWLDMMMNVVGVMVAFLCFSQLQIKFKFLLAEGNQD